MSRPKLLPEQALPQTPQPSPHLTLKPQASRILLRLTTTSRTTGLVILLVLSRAIVAMCTPLDILTMATIRRSLSCWLLTGKLGLSRGYTARGLLLLAQTIMQTEMPEVTTIMITSTCRCCSGPSTLRRRHTGVIISENKVWSGILASPLLTSCLAF